MNVSCITIGNLDQGLILTTNPSWSQTGIEPRLRYESVLYSV
jgi:hypothetical protein